LDKLKEFINGKSKKDKYKARNNVRHIFQSFWFLVTNSFFEGFKTGKIYSGELKATPVREPRAHAPSVPSRR